MKVTVENQSSVKKVLHIEVPLEVVAREVNSAYGELKKTAKVKGFRPGKAPRTVLERVYGKDVLADVSSKAYALFSWSWGGSTLGMPTIFRLVSLRASRKPSWTNLDDTSAITSLP